MSTNKNNSVKSIVILAAPILLFAILLIPYNWVNQQFIVDWFGCGCPKVDEVGNIIHPDFNANDFTALFWSFISVCVTVISVFLSRRISKDKMWLRLLYVAAMLAVSLMISKHFCQMMMWN